MIPPGWRLNIFIALFDFTSYLAKEGGPHRHRHTNLITFQWSKITDAITASAILCTIELKQRLYNLKGEVVSGQEVGSEIPNDNPRPPRADKNIERALDQAFSAQRRSRRFWRPSD